MVKRLEDAPGTIKRKCCRRCGGDMKAEAAEYGVEWVCLNMCGARITTDQLLKDLRDQEEIRRAAAVKNESNIDKNETITNDPDPSMEKSDPRTRVKKCRSCRYFRKEGSETWCITKSCPSHYPRSLRPVYKPTSGDHLTPDEKAQIIAYAKKAGVRAAGLMFNMPWRSVRSLVAAAAKKPKANRQQIPELPHWQEAWGDAVKIEWIRTVRAMIEGKGQ